MTPETELLPFYDAGLLGDGGGGNVDWWHDYIRSELERAHEFYLSYWESRPAPKAIDVEGLIHAIQNKIMLEDDYETATHGVEYAIKELNSRGLFGQVDQAAIDALEVIEETFAVAINEGFLIKDGVPFEEIEIVKQAILKNRQQEKELQRIVK